MELATARSRTTTGLLNDFSDKLVDIARNVLRNVYCSQEHYDFRLRLERSHFDRNFLSVHFGHTVVGDDHIHPISGGQFQPFAAAWSHQTVYPRSARNALSHSSTDRSLSIQRVTFSCAHSWAARGTGRLCHESDGFGPQKLFDIAHPRFRPDESVVPIPHTRDRPPRTA
jgi:hypothetical protein